MLTGDHDMLQLVDERISVVIMKKGHGNYMVYTPGTTYGRARSHSGADHRRQGPDGRCQRQLSRREGDWGENGAQARAGARLRGGILENLEQLSKAVRAKIEADLDMLHLSRRLATIHCEAPVMLEMDDCGWAVDRAAVERKFDELEFRSLISLIS